MIDPADDFDRVLKKHLDDLHPSARQQFLRQVVYEQIIASIPADVAYLQGGAGVRCQLKFAPQTKDVDLLLRKEVAAEANLLSMPGQERKRFLVGYTRKLIDARPPDFCKLRIINARSFDDVRVNELAAQLVFEAEVGTHKLQHTVELDFGIQTYPVNVKQIRAENLLGFAGVRNPDISVLTPEEIVATKICVYLEHHDEPVRFRAQDIAHAAALISNYHFEKELFASALAFNALQREIVNKLALPLPAPILPQSRSLWQFEDLAKQCKIPTDINATIKLLSKSYNAVRLQAHKLALEFPARMRDPS